MCVVRGRQALDREFFDSAAVLCDPVASAMHTSPTLWIVTAAVLVSFVGIVTRIRRGRSTDLGSVSTSWTTQHNVGDRSGDRSRG
jgi:hypothetical protein